MVACIHDDDGDDDEVRKIYVGQSMRQNGWKKHGQFAEMPIQSNLAQYINAGQGGQ